MPALVYSQSESSGESVAPAEHTASLSQRELHAGVYCDGEYWVAVNRSQAEDTAKTSPVETVDALFDGLSYRRIDVDVGDTSALASELWRIFLIAMAVALIVEAVLSLPRPENGSHPFNRPRNRRGKCGIVVGVQGLPLSRTIYL